MNFQISFINPTSYTLVQFSLSKEWKIHLGAKSYSIDSFIKALNEKQFGEKKILFENNFKVAPILINAYSPNDLGKHLKEMIRKKREKALLLIVV